MLNPSSFFMDAINKNSFLNNESWNPQNKSWRLTLGITTRLVGDRSLLSQPCFIYLYIFPSSPKQNLNRWDGTDIRNSHTCLAKVNFFNILFYFLKFN